MLHGTVPVGVSEWREVQGGRGGRSECCRAIARRGTGLWEGRQRGHGTMRLPDAMSMLCVCCVRVVRMVALLLLVGRNEAAGGCLKALESRAKGQRLQGDGAAASGDIGGRGRFAELGESLRCAFRKRRASAHGLFELRGDHVSRSPALSLRQANPSQESGTHACISGVPRGGVNRRAVGACEIPTSRPPSPYEKRRSLGKTISANGSPPKVGVLKGC
jgi:hypothetical protein